MIRDITIGQYYRTKSLIHRLDPRTKIIGAIIFIVSMFLFRGFAGFLPVLIFFLLCFGLSRVPAKFVLRGLKPVFLLVVTTAILNLLFTPGQEVFQFYGIKISEDGVKNAVFFSFRLVLIIIGSSIMTLTTSPNRLTDGLESVLSPLSIIKVPVHELAMMMSIALRFIPILIEELNRIMKAQMARGVAFDEGNIFHRLKSMIPILVPLFAAAIRRAGELSEAMDSRCYQGGAGRTKMYPLRYHRRDYLAFLVMGLYFVVVILVDRYVPF